MSEWRWLNVKLVLAIHQEQLAAHGGGNGVRDTGLLESALARPRNLVAYGDPDAADLAAAYGFGIARNHPFVDGNKRTALVACETFLNVNSLDLLADDAELVALFESLAAGELDEEALAQWLRERLSDAA